MFDRLEQLIKEADYFNDRYYEAEEDEEDAYLLKYENKVNEIVNELIKVTEGGLDVKSAQSLANYNRDSILKILSRRK